MYLLQFTNLFLDEPELESVLFNDDLQVDSTEDQEETLD